MILLDASRLTARRPDRPLFVDLSLTVADGDRIGVVGINGCGKTTLLRMLARDGEPQENPDGTVGEVRWGRGTRVGALVQRPHLPPGTVRDAAGHAWQGEAMLTRLGMGDLLDAPTDALSGGQAKRVALARLLAGDHDLLVLDEPTNHLDLDAIAFLEQWLAAYRGGLVMVTHDRHVLDRVTTRVLELDRGSAHLHVPSGRHAGSGYAAYLEGRAERETRAEVAEQTRRTLATRELAWLRRGAPARTSKPKARIAAATALVEARPQEAARAGELSLSMGAQRLGSKGIELRDVSFSWPDGTDVLAHVSVQLEPGDRIGVVGANGAGKSTLLELIAGRLQPTAGAVEVGATVRIGHYDQLGRTLDERQRVRDAVAGDKGQPSLDDVALMRRFWFDGDAQFAPIGLLSGGERRRLQLLLTLLDQPNVLLLDEPTNDLDLDTLRALEDLLDDWPGIAVVVSHDRAFLDRTVEHVWAVEPGGVREVRGGVAGWLAERAAAPSTSGSSAAAPSTTPAPASRATRPPRPTGGRSPSTVRRQLGQAERELQAATERRDALTARLSAPSDHRELARLGDDLTAAQHALDAAEERWLELAAEAEALGLDVSD
ncbi:MAG: ABC-F family ATP-binding cassette domain-containing protein [Acidimicrobiales bacterium]|nr:ABC-F family ATP-binding cassette domain-containing protein [Acidimicrobiales bacterium]MCB9392118.1 ABC-F family ATP-binding cassette domain-containing protein [Acidimicrobiaceae bacterium]